MPMGEELNATALWPHCGDQSKGRTTCSTLLSCPFSCFNQQHSVLIIANNMPQARRWDTQLFYQHWTAAKGTRLWEGSHPHTTVHQRSTPTCHFTSCLASTHNLSYQHNFEYGKCPLLNRYLGHMYTWEKDWN